MKCPNCGFDSPPDKIFCGKCGTRLTRMCSSCGLASPLDYRYCGQCGASLTDMSLPAQTFRLSPPPSPIPDELVPAGKGSTPPPEDASPQAHIQPTTTPLTGERRLATIIVADVKGSTDLMEKIGTEDWVEVMNKILQFMASEILRFGGEVDQFRGDGLVAFFGARSAHEDDPERAVLAALMMQLAIQRLSVELKENKGIDLQIRVGINTGEVIAANIGNLAQHSEDTAMGGAIALAARLESAAEAGTVLVSEDTYRLTELQFRWEFLGEMSVRGISNPVTVYRPLAPLSEAEQEHRLQEYGLSIPLIGRENEINRIQNAIQYLRQGVGGIVMISGVAGLGKSRLISEIEQSVKREEALSPEGGQKITWLRGRCRSYGHSLPHSMWIDALHRWLEIQEWETQEEVLKRLQHKTRDLWGDQYMEYYPYLAKFLSLPLAKSFLDWVEHLEAEGLRHQFFFVIQRWVEALARRGPTVIVFTEVHWADEASLALLEHCLPLCDREPVSWMVVFRPDPAAPTWALDHFVETEYPHRLTSIELSALSRSDSSGLLNQLTGSDVLPENMREAILDKAEGNPYYLTEIVRSLIDRDVLVRSSDNGHWKVTQTNAPLDLPNTLIGLLTARITRLSPADQRVLQLAAVIGTVFWSELLQALTGNDTPIQEHLTSLQRARLIRERGCLTDLGTEYVFLSGLIRDAAYESLLSSPRANYHLMAADFLEGLVSENMLSQYHGLIAYHYRQAKVCQKELFHTLLAAENAQRVYANAEAIHQYSLVLELLDELDDCEYPPTHRSKKEWRLEALTGLGQIYFGIGEIAPAESHLREAIASGREMGLDALALTRLFYWLGEVLFWQNQYEEPIHLGEEGLYYLGENNKNVEAALMNQLVAVGCSQLGDHEKFIEFTQRTAGFIQNLPYTEELRPAYDHIIGLYAYTLKDVPEAERWLAVFEQKAEENHDLRAMGEVYNHTASLLNRQGDLNSALHYYEIAIEHFDRIGDDKHTCRALRGLGACFLQTGNLDKAEEHIHLSLEKARIIANKIDLALGYWFEAQIFLCRGLLEDATATFEKAHELIQDIPVIKGGWAFLGLGQVHFSQANAQEITGTYQFTLENDPNLVFRNPYQAANILGKLERTYEHPEDFRAYVDQFRKQHSNLSHASFSQWYLVPGEVGFEFQKPKCHEKFEGSVSDSWEWIDPFGDCSYSVEDGLLIQAANERNFHHINRSAPRMIQKTPITGDFAIQTVCSPISDEKPAIGGLLVWQNEKNWLCLEFGARGTDEVIFRGFKDNNDLVFGRGRLHSTAAYLRLEKHGYQVSAYCSPDGENWFFAGNTHIPSGESIYPGVHTNGHINRLIYPGAYPEGSAIRFEELKLWSDEENMTENASSQ
ncbi:MAG: adenylate/guanylate cyclase domain-containing protein [Chloroflexota bacterium]